MLCIYIENNCLKMAALTLNFSQSGWTRENYS